MSNSDNNINNNTDKIKNYNIDVTCEICNKSYKKSNETNHNRTKLHIMKSLESKLSDEKCSKKINDTSAKKVVENNKTIEEINIEEINIEEIKNIIKKEKEEKKILEEKYVKVLEYNSIINKKLLDLMDPK